MIYMLIRDQINVVGALDAGIVWRTIDGYGIRNKTDCWERVTLLGREFKPKRGAE